MKKLNKLTINPSRMMGNEELVSLRGGYYIALSQGTCGAYLPSSPSAGQIDVNSVNSGNQSMEYSNGTYVFRNISQSDAQTLINNVSGARWCCDSCGSATWY